MSGMLAINYSTFTFYKTQPIRSYNICNVFVLGMTRKSITGTCEATRKTPAALFRRLVIRAKICAKYFTARNLF